MGIGLSLTGVTGSIYDSDGTKGIIAVWGSTKWAEKNMGRHYRISQSFHSVTHLSSYSKEGHHHLNMKEHRSKMEGSTFCHLRRTGRAK